MELVTLFPGHLVVHESCLSVFGGEHANYSGKCRGGGVLLANQCFLQHFLAGPLAPNLRKWEHKCKCHRGQCSCRCVAEYGIQTCCKKHQNEILLLQRVESSLPWILVGQISEFCWSKLEAGGGDPCRCTTKSLPFLWRSCKGQGKR